MNPMLSVDRVHAPAGGDLQYCSANTRQVRSRSRLNTPRFRYSSNQE